CPVDPHAKSGLVLLRVAELQEEIKFLLIDHLWLLTDAYGQQGDDPISAAWPGIAQVESRLQALFRVGHGENAGILGAIWIEHDNFDIWGLAFYRGHPGACPDPFEIRVRTEDDPFEPQR